jgi:apolipoprotein N-acyltransferase
MVRYGGLSTPVSVLLVLGMCAILGLYTAGFLGTMAHLCRRWGPGALALAPFAWVLWEWLRGTLLTGFPWWGPGYSLSVYQAFVPAARWFGVLGLSFMVLLAASAAALYARQRQSPVALGVLVAALLVLGGTFGWGWWWSSRPPLPWPKDTVGYIQPQIGQDEKWDARFAGEIRTRLGELTIALAPYHPKLVIWPESCTPLTWEEDTDFRNQVKDLAREVKCPILLGTVLTREGAYMNGAVLVQDADAPLATYAKTHLVPFGEYVPLKHLLFFAKPLVEAVGDFRPGTDLAPMSTPAGKAGVTICYEGIFPSLVRRQVAMGAELLINITNDAWYEGTPGPVQHYLMERVRAVENDRYLIRSANGGVSGVVDPRGHLQAATTPDVAASFWGLVEPRRTRTLWSRVGDWWLMVPLGVVLLMSLFVPRRRSAEA